MRCILALDQGTTSSRAIVFDEAGAIRGSAQQEFRQIFPQPGWVEHDATEIWATQSGVMHEALAKAGVSARDVAGMCIAYGVATLIFFQGMVNIGVNLNVVPVSGLPLPFISYGGSGLTALMLGIGLVQSVAMRHKQMEF